MYLPGTWSCVKDGTFTNMNTTNEMLLKINLTYCYNCYHGIVCRSVVAQCLAVAVILVIIGVEGELMMVMITKLKMWSRQRR